MPDPTPAVHSRYAISSAVKTLQVLFAFEGTQGPTTLQELSRRAGLTTNQTFRCLKSLEDFGLVQEVRSGYALTPTLLRLTPSVLHEPLLIDVAETALLALRDDTGETVNLMALIGNRETLCLATYPSPQSVRLVTQVGQRALLHAGATSKAVLAWLSESEQEDWLRMLPLLPRLTESTVLDPELLRSELAATRERGYSITDQDYEPGARGVGAPILGPDGRPIGGLSVGGPHERVDDRAIERFGRLAVEAAARISRRLGYRAPAVDVDTAGA